jgi:hypothetical protein
LPDRALNVSVMYGSNAYTGYLAILADSPDYYFRLGEPSGPFADSSGNGITATETSGTYTRGTAGPDPVITGVTNSTNALLLQTNFGSSLVVGGTREGWFKSTSTTLNALSFCHNASGVGLGIIIGPTGFGSAAGQVTAFFTNTSYWLGVHTTATVNDGNWHHIAATWGGTAGVALATSQLKVYIDGVLTSTTADAGNTGSTSIPPISSDLHYFAHHAGAGSASYAEVASFPVELSGARILEHMGLGFETAWLGGAIRTVDGDDATYNEITGVGVLRLDLGDAFAIARTRLLIGTETSGSKSYALYGANEADFSDAVLVTTLTFTATGSFTADDINQSWVVVDAYQFWELDGDDETRYVYSWELYEQGALTPGDISAIEADITVLQGDVAALQGIDYLVGTATAELSAEIVVGTTPGGELGGTWGSPTVDGTHSGSAHTDFIAKAIVDAKGDIIAATAADTVARVAVGTDGQYLKADSAATAGVSWVTPPTPSTGGTSDHEHIQNIVFSGDGATTVWELPAAPVDAASIQVFVTASRSIAWNLSGTLLTTLTFDAAPANASDNIVIDIVAATA